MSQKHARSSQDNSDASDLETSAYDENESDAYGDTSEEELYSDRDDVESDNEEDVNLSSEEEEEEEEENIAGGSYSGGAWCTIVGDDCMPHSVPFTGVPGPRRMPDAKSHPIEYVNLFLTNQFIDSIVRETNKYAKQFIEDKGEYLARHPRSRIHTSWIKKGNTTREEFRAFLGILIAMGLIEKPTIFISFFKVNDNFIAKLLNKYSWMPHLWSPSMHVLFLWLLPSMLDPYFFHEQNE